MAGKLLRINGTIRSWSFSRLRDWEQCGFLAGLKHVLGRKEPGNAAMQRGSNIGKLAEEYVKGNIRVMPAELQNFAAGFKDLRALRKKDPGSVVVEETWAFRSDWSRTVYNDWTGAWCRIKMDVATLTADKRSGQPFVDVIDHKTGKYNPDYDFQVYLDQIELYAMGALLIYGEEHPDVTVRAKLWFLDHGVEHPADKEYALADLPGLKKRWEARVRPMLADKTFRAKPSTKCQWCFFRAANGGPCTH